MLTISDLEVADSPALLKDMFSYLNSCDVFAFDFETRSVDFAAQPKGALNRMQMLPDLFSAATNDRVFVVPIGMITTPCIDLQEFIDVAKPVMENPDIYHDGWNWSFDAHVFANQGVWVRTYRDWMVAAALLDDNRSKSLKERCLDIGMALHKYDFMKYWKARDWWFNQDRIEYTKTGRKRVLKEYTEEEIAVMEREYIDYSAEDSIATMFLGKKYELDLRKEDTWDLFHRLRNPAVRTAFMMERRGICIDVPSVAEKKAQAEADLIIAEAEVLKEAGTHFNVTSTKEVSIILYNKMGLPVKKTTLKGAPSSDAETLSMLGQDGYPIAIALSKHRKVAKIMSAYLSDTSKFSGGIQPWGYIHPSFNTVGTRTGRWSSSDPNFMQLPHNTPANYLLREVIIPSNGMVLVGGDLSQAELRVMADLSQDPEMLMEYQKDTAFQQCLIDGKDPKEMGLVLSDIHQTTADSCGSSRQSAKGINFGLIYRMAGQTLSRFLTKSIWDYKFAEGDYYSWDPLNDKISTQLGEEYKDLYFDKYAGVAAYHKMIEQRLQSYGYITSRFGQKRRLPEINSNDNYERWRAVTQGINFSIQGHVGELMTLCMNRVHRDKVLKEHGFRLILQVHDEILGECYPEGVDIVKQRLAEIFMRPMAPTKARPYYGYRVPIIFEPAHSYDNWAKIH